MSEQKSPELIQAQVAAFASDKVKNYGDKKHILDNLGKIATGGLKDVVRTTTTNEYQTNESGVATRIPQGTEIIAGATEDFKEYLRSVGGSKSESIQGRADMLKAYEKFIPEIQQLRYELAKYKASKTTLHIWDKDQTQLYSQ